MGHFEEEMFIFTYISDFQAFAGKMSTKTITRYQMEIVNLVSWVRRVVKHVLPTTGFN